MRGSVSNSARIAWVCATAALVFVVWLALAPVSRAGVGFFYAVPVGLAAWWGGRRAALATIVGCSALYLVGAQIHDVDELGLALGVRVLAFVVVAVLVSLLHERLTVLEHSAEELEAIRAALTPATLPELPGVDAAAAFLPSEHGVSGDFYLLTNGPDGSTVAIVGDVVGHGPDAARLATFVRARFAALAASTSDPAELLTMTNEALLDRPRRREEMVSAACLRLRGEDARLSWAIAGHPPPLQLPNLDELAPCRSTFLLGAEPGLVLRNAERDLGEEEGVVVYTDGATDIRRGGRLLGLEGLRRLLGPLAGLPARELVSRAEKAMLAWADEPARDDLCLLVLKPRAVSR